MAASDKEVGVVARDRRNFTEAEFKRELELHHVKVGKGESAGAIYRKQDETVRERPRSGVFRDFMEYGVHPMRVIVQEFRISLPFILRSLSAEQVSLETTNQRQRTEDRKTPETKWEEEEAADRRDMIITPEGAIRRPASIDSAFELIKVIQERKSHVGWTPALQHYMSALNLFLFRVGGRDKIPARFLVPPRERAMIELTGLVSRKIALKEIEERILKDPSHWASTSPDSATLADIASLMGELMTNETYSSDLREIVDWYKRAFRMSQLVTLIETIIDRRQELIVTLRVRTSLVAAAQSR